MSRRILLVDNNETYLEELKRLLKHPGYVIKACDESVEAMDEIRQFKPELILLDIKSRELRGIQLAAMVNMTEDTRHIPMVLISGIMNKDEIADAMQRCNIRHFIEKPVNPSELLTVIHSILGK
jgi:two-component SAPR family response regulator